MPTDKKQTVLFLTLKTFGFTGGIEKISRAICKVLYDCEKKGLIKNQVYSMYDLSSEKDLRYISGSSFKGFARKKSQFAITSIFKGITSDILILSHVNLIPIAALIKILRPSVRIFLFAHGIEIWNRLNYFKRFFLKRIHVIAVSEYTKQRVLESQSLKPQKITVLNNSLDPFYKFPNEFEKPQELLDRYGLNKDQTVLFTLSRLSISEKHKGYDVVIEILSKILIHYPDICYLIGGKYDLAEKVRIDSLIKDYNMEDHIILTGFLDENELSSHFLLADLYIMPSKKEGFGIVFIEAMASGLPTIGGNKDGTVDALRNGDLGILVNPDNKEEITLAILEQIESSKYAHNPLTLQRKCLDYFNFERYRFHLQRILLQQTE